ncbi:SPRTN [Branchiostoma lanceolatum]|uniref:DNA-dependent metalloprotease SPRTN n=1 Tax=Branchiostoma lanceolatum TaxID=7740 RepID=A0A8J9ZUW4_BRALA|nr:SPRTN [Branchiostoma lanceolatum]
MCDADLILALQLQEQFDREMAENVASSDGEGAAASSSSSHHPGSKSLSIVDQSWELTDPNPNVHALFREFNATYFWGKLDCVEVKWSPRMTLCAGLCCYEGRGGLCCIKLSLPLLKLRPRKDLVETLLHEMIHALLFVTHNNKDHDAHGPEFLKHMKRINTETGTNISVYHNFHDEVDVYRQHWWRCDGPCQKWKPYFGIVRRAMNRAPSARDPWWANHQQKCGGTYEKIKEPEGYSNKKGGKRKKGQDTGAAEGAAPSKKQASSTNYGNIELFAGKGFVLGTKSGSSAAGKGLKSTQRLPSASTSTSASSTKKTANNNQSTTGSPPGLPSLSGSNKTSTGSTRTQSTTSILSTQSDNVMSGYQNSGHKGKDVTKHTPTKDGANSLHRPSASRQKTENSKNLKITDMFGQIQAKQKGTVQAHDKPTCSGLTSYGHSSSQTGSGKTSVGHSSVDSDVHTEALVSCPVCGEQLPVATINQHLDLCL